MYDMNFNGNYLIFMSTLYIFCPLVKKYIYSELLFMLRQERKKNTISQLTNERILCVLPKKKYIFMWNLYNLLYFNKSIYMHYIQGSPNHSDSTLRY